MGSSGNLLRSSRRGLTQARGRTRDFPRHVRTMPDLACRPQAKARHTPSNARAGTRGAMATAHKEQHAGAPRDKTPIAVGTTWVAGLEACNAAQRVVTRCARPSRDLLDPQLSPHPPDVHPRRVRRT